MSEYICQEIITQILECLPVKILLRFRCVCKWMRKTIDSHGFMLQHLSLQKPRLLLQSGLDLDRREFLVLDSCKLPLIDPIREPIWMDRLFLVGTLHGVVCLYEMDFGLRFWNPSTRELSSRRLHRLPEKSLKSGPQENYCYSGFWINPSNKQFKVIIFRLWALGGSAMKAVLYRSTEARWRRLAVRGQMVTCRCRLDGHGSQMSPAVIIGQVGYWMGIRDEGVIGKDGKPEVHWVIISFDFGQGRFDLIKMPVTIHGVHDRVNFYRQGNLSLLHWINEERRCGVYSRKDDSWAHMYQFNFISPVREIFWVMGKMERGGKALAATGHELVLYDSRDGIIHLKNVDWIHVLITYDFVESLLFPSRL